MTAEYNYLLQTSGPRLGSNYMLEAFRVNRLGRGVDCDVVLADPLCSREHAELYCEGDRWYVRDLDSRNGTFVGDQRVTTYALNDGDTFRIGTTEFTFFSTDEQPTAGSGTRDTGLTEEIVRQANLDSEQSSSESIANLQRKNEAIDLTNLFELSLQLLGCDEPRQVTLLTLERIHQSTRAAVVGFLWISDEGELKPYLVVPEDASSEVTLSQSLTAMVIEQRRAVWVNHTSTASASSADSLRPYADALCVPVLHEGRPLGAIHLYVRQGRFLDSDFDFAISVSHVLAAALARSRRQASLQAEHQRLVDSSAACEEMIGTSPALERLKQKVAKVAPAHGCVLIWGESGSGKELVAHAVHQGSRRADRPLLAVNCAAIPENLVESQLFGHVKGSFTGAADDHLGWFRQADSGTLFLDEIGELPLEAQGKLLRILEDHPFLPVGGTQEVQVDVRVIAATNRDLREDVREKRFREDLYYRLSVFELKVPPLRDREGDAALLVDHFLEHFRRKHGKPKMELSEAARAKLLEYRWPGNVRQLRNVIDSAVVLANGSTIEPEDLGLYDAGTEHLDSLLISDWEQKLIRMALRQTVGNVPQAAELLGIGRATLYRKIDEYKIDRR